MGEFHFQSSFIYYGQNQPIFMKKNLSIFMTAGSWLQRALALFLCVAALEAVQAAPQDTKRTITGTVVDQNNLPVVGATVMISNSANGTATDSNGQFTLSGVTDNDELQISFLGYKTVTMQVGTRTAIAATLEEDSGYLDEVVVVGYGTTTRRHIISAVSTVKSEAIENRPVANIQQALQGAAANLIIQTKNFNPTDNQMNISIRGVNTMGNNTPLVVIDGVPQPDAGRMNDLNPNDIESINILKDAGSAAIYGARSSNGVILITTKNGRKEMAPQIRFSAKVGIENPDILYKAVPTYRNAILRNEALSNVGREPLFPAARAFLRAELGVQEGEILFGHVGRFCEQKNHAGLLRIFAGVSRRMPNARLVLIGTGELVDSTRALAQELNLSDRVIFAGVRKDMAALYHAMDVFLLPSLFEGLPVVLVEAQAAGLPCFVADTVDPGAAFAGNIHYLPLQNEAAWADSIAAADLTRDPSAQAKAIAAGFDVHTSAGILQKFYLEQTQKYTKEVQP